MELITTGAALLWDARDINLAAGIFIYGSTSIVVATLILHLALLREIRKYFPAK